jgi:hypothetical protein
MPLKLSIALESVHLWWADRARDASEINRFQELLSPSERDRTGRFRTAEMRRLFVRLAGHLLDIFRAASLAIEGPPAVVRDRGLL